MKKTNKIIFLYIMLVTTILLGAVFSSTTAIALTADIVKQDDTTIVINPSIMPLPVPPPPPQPGVEVIKKVWDGVSWVDSATFEVGDDILFRIVLKNIGNVNLDSYVHVDDDLPSFLTYNYDSNLTPTSASDNHIEWHNLAPLNYNCSIEITYSAHAESSGQSENAVAVEAQHDCMPPVDDCDIVTVIVEYVCDDDEPPITIKEYGAPFYTDGVDDWINSDTLIWLNATDDDSGVLHTFYRISKWNGETWVIEIDWAIYTGPFTIPSECKYKIEFYSVDNCCNQEQIQWQTVFVDNTPPCTWWEITHDPDHYVCKISTLTIGSEDGGLCAVGDYTIYCYINGELYKTKHNGEISFQFNENYGFYEEGEYVIEFWAVDILGNEEDHQIETFILDYTPPVTDYGFIGPNRWVFNHWEIEETTKIILNASDSGSGVKFTKYMQGIEDEIWEIYSGPFLPDEEDIYYYSKDNVGNQEILVRLPLEIVDSIDNQPPLSPNQPSGSNQGNVLTSYSYKTKTTDPEHEKIKYYFNWGDGTGEWTDFKSSDQEITKSHTWTSAGTYEVKVKAQDESGAESPWSAILTVNIVDEGNQPPEKPSKPSGPSSGKPDTEYSYLVTTTDPEDDLVYYLVDWGDTTDSGWIGPYESGEMISIEHIFTKKGSYQIKVKAKDYYGEESVWSDPISVNMPRYKSILKTFLFRLMENFPFLEKIINKLPKI